MALVYNAADAAQSHAAQQLTQQIKVGPFEWDIGIDVPGLLIFYKSLQHQSCECYSLHDRAGVVLGALFERHSIHATSRSAFGVTQSASIIASGGRQLIDTHWGSYVAFLHDAREGRKWILRGPVGHLPCYRTTSKGVHIYFSQDFASADLTPRDVNWSYIAALMLAGREAENTGLKGVFKVQPGECVEHYRDRITKRMYWNPATVASTDVIENPEDAAQMLRQVTKSCVHAWAARHSSILVNLSGGLDSSIVLGCLKDAPTSPAIKCLTHYSTGARSDERRFARLAAEHAGYELIEWQRNPNIDLRDMLQISRSPEPRTYFRRVEMSRVEASFAKQNSATALFGGGGGDQLFWQSNALIAVADCIYRHHFGKLLHVAYDAAQLERILYWRVLREAIRDGLVPQPWEPLEEVRAYRTLLAEEGVTHSQRDEASIPMWLQASTHIPPGKRRHILSLTSRAYYDSFRGLDGPESIAPLMSQPIVEVCLRIPTYLAIKGGWYRAVARQAFSQDVPLPILRRRSKGGMEEHLLAIWANNLPFAREILLNGSLVQAGLLDDRKLADALSERPSTVMKDLAQLFWYLCIEVWIRRMTTTSRQKAA